jgi:hypothetical protein
VNPALDEANALQARIDALEPEPKPEVPAKEQKFCEECEALVKLAMSKWEAADALSKQARALRQDAHAKLCNEWHARETAKTNERHVLALARNALLASIVTPQQYIIDAGYDQARDVYRGQGTR